MYTPILRRHRNRVFLVAAWCALAGLTVAGEPAYNVEVQADAKIPMSDGVELAAPGLCVAAAEDAAKLCADLGHVVEPVEFAVDVEAFARATRVITSGER